ncbi:MAG: glutamine-hydrolyzing GMP synthase [Methanomassiliicoccaceae archaeon]|jgi:GMP synthase (glutamine-hydrolysing)|nr:glutamine-hydrolyzing GMP synthase [Methanomassiliicoccaceae archaeon]
MFDAKALVDDQVKNISAAVKGKAIIACSGGVDSVVSAVIASKAIGDRLLAVYVDTGLMRKGETEEVRGMLKALNVNFKILDAADDFFASLKGVTEPEAKRKAIGERFIRCFEKEAKEFGAKYLVQGTIAPDIIESGKDGKGVVKSHHNVGGIPKEMGLVLVEPLRELYKDDVRQVARFLGIKESERQPFPGPGLAVRCLGEVTPENTGIVREACHIVEDEIQKASKAGKMALPWQYFAALLPIRSVGVHNRERIYGRTVVIRAVLSKDGMTAKCAEIPFAVLTSIASRITREMGDKVNRIVYDVTDKPPATIEWE